jgi:hypothetical protein
MKKLLAKLEDIMVAITFAEASEFEEAVKLSGTAPRCGEEDDAVTSLNKAVLEKTTK